jgi:membrane-associated phospholipid phosphatase
VILPARYDTLKAMSFPKTSRLPDIRGTFAKRWTGAGTGLLFVLATLACMVAFVATYYFFVRTTTGQYIDESALVEAATINGPAERATTQFLDWLPVISVAIAAVVVLFVTIMRRRWKSAGIALAACVAANLATQLLKDWFPNRPFRGVQTIELNSLPSGHTTLAASAAASAATPPRTPRRPGFPR